MSRETEQHQGAVVDEKELLELAAKAAGYEIGSPGPTGGFYFCAYREATRSYGPYREWNPINDDGDALRLAVKLEFGMSSEGGAALVHHRTGVAKEYAEQHGGDVNAATRRAITVAAAAIGRTM